MLGGKENVVIMADIGSLIIEPVHVPHS